MITRAPWLPYSHNLRWPFRILFQKHSKKKDVKIGKVLTRAGQYMRATLLGIDCRVKFITGERQTQKRLQ